MVWSVQWLRPMKLMALGVIALASMVSLEARADTDYIFDAYITQVSAKGSGDKLFRLNSDEGGPYSAPAPVYIRQVASDPELADPRQEKSFWAMVLLAHTTGRLVDVEMKEVVIDVGGVPQTRWVATTISLK